MSSLCALNMSASKDDLFSPSLSNASVASKGKNQQIIWMLMTHCFPLF